MASSGKQSPVDVTSRASANPVWNNPTNLETVGGADADSNLPFVSGTTAWADCHDFSAGFASIPPATIDGIEVFLNDTITSTGNINMEPLILGLEPDVAPISRKATTTLALLTYGASNDLWGGIYTDVDVKDVDFGPDFRGFNSSTTLVVNVDSIEMIVHYTASAAVTVTGTVIGATESQIAAGGRTIILDLTGETWLAVGAAFDGSRQAIIDGIDSAQAETLGWQNEVQATLGVAQVVRTSNTKVTITLLAAETADYKITADEVLTATIPASAHSGTTILTDANFATITAECDQTIAPGTIITQTNLTGAVTDIDESVDAPDGNWLLVA